MKLTIAQTATKLGVSDRQVRYLIQQGKLPARKIGRRWMIDSADLPVSDNQRKAHERRQRQLRTAVEDVLETATGPGRSRYSVRDLKATQIAVPLYRQSADAFGADHPATRAGPCVTS